MTFRPLASFTQASRMFHSLGTVLSKTGVPLGISWTAIVTYSRRITIVWRKPSPIGPFRASRMAAPRRIEDLNSSVRVALPSAYPYRPALMSMAGRIAAQGP